MHAHTVPNQEFNYMLQSVVRLAATHGRTTTDKDEINSPFGKELSVGLQHGIILRCFQGGAYGTCVADPTEAGHIRLGGGEGA